jgi:uncharacterized membrane protein
MDQNTPPPQETVPPDGPPPPPLTLRPTLWQRLRAYFLTGLVVTAPIAITIYLAWLFVDSIDRAITPLIPPRYSPETYLPFGLPGFGLIVAVVFITLLGALTANFLGRYLLGLGERVVSRMPIIRTVYATLKQIFETVVSQSSASFKEVVLVEYPRPGLWAVAFVTADASGEIKRTFDADMVNVFLPTTPNPTSGFLLFVPRKDLVHVNMSVEDGIKLVVSAGIINPADKVMPDALKATQAARR